MTETGTADQPVSDQASVTTNMAADGLHVLLSAPKTDVKSVELRWTGNIDPATRCLGDTWERAYADLGCAHWPIAGRCRGTFWPTPTTKPTATV